MMLQTRNFLQTASDKLQKHIDGSWHDEAKNTKESALRVVVGRNVCTRPERLY